jgi:hypothetical protein
MNSFSEFVSRKMEEHKIGLPSATDYERKEMALIEWVLRKKIVINGIDYVADYKTFIEKAMNHYRKIFHDYCDFNIFILALRDWNALPIGDCSSDGRKLGFNVTKWTRLGNPG